VPDKRSAIPPDELLERPIEELSAAEFIYALNHPDLDQTAVRLLPDKKKYELWVEETDVTKLTPRDLIDRLRNEKKKYELEPPVILKPPPPEYDLSRLNPLNDPPFLEALAARVAEKLKQR
jgi:hypothetical protein